MQVTTIGLAIAKSVFPVHGIDARGRVVLRRRLARGKVLTFFASLPRCLIGLEACGARRSAPTSGGRRWEPGAHHWARELARLGHDTRLMPPQHVKAYVRTNKHDAADAEACCEAVPRPSTRFVAVKSESRQATLMLHRVRDQLIGQRMVNERLKPQRESHGGGILRPARLLGPTGSTLRPASELARRS